jgi:predicted HTH transcriptional regulator
VFDISPAPVDVLIEDTSSKIYELCRDEGAKAPYTVIREMVENFIHADFVEPVVSILDSGATVRFADHGPGFADKQRALLPGFTTARGDIKRHIRGVGSGLPTVVDYLRLTGGSLEIDENIGGGAVVTIRFAGAYRESPNRAPSEPPSPTPGADTRPRLSSRQHQVLALVLETGSAGPSMVSKELGVGVSTAHRDLEALEEAGLITSDSGRRKLTPAGACFLDELLNHN